jgi:hypothetical protein
MRQLKPIAFERFDSGIVQDAKVGGTGTDVKACDEMGIGNVCWRPDQQPVQHVGRGLGDTGAFFIACPLRARFRPANFYLRAGRAMAVLPRCDWAKLVDGCYGGRRTQIAALQRRSYIVKLIGIISRQIRRPPRLVLDKLNVDLSDVSALVHEFFTPALPHCHSLDKKSALQRVGSGR